MDPAPTEPQPVTSVQQFIPPTAPVQGSQVVAMGKKKRRLLKPLLLCLLCEVLIGCGVAAYYWRDNQAMIQKTADDETIQTLQQQVTDLESMVQQYDSAESFEQY